MTKRGMATAPSPLNIDGGRSCSSCSNGRSRHPSSIASRRAVGIRPPAETSSRSEHVALDAATSTIKRERRGGECKDRKRHQSQQPGARNLPEHIAQEEDLGEQEQPVHRK